MGKTNYSEKLKHPKWQKKRLEIMKRDKFKCRYCGDTETTLNVHHLNYEGDPWEAKNEDLITVCEHCHYEIKNCELKESSPIYIYKSNDWVGDDRIMFVVKKDVITMRIYDGQLKYIIGFNFQYHTIIDIKKIISIYQKNQ